MAYGGKFQLALPFSKRLPDMPKKKPVESQKILNCDLGLKTFATLSVTRNGVEIDRRFLDQKQLTKQKNIWFYQNKERKKLQRGFNQKTTNFKWILQKLRKRLDGLQSEMSKKRERNKQNRRKNPKFPRYDKTIEYWYIRREYKKCILKMQNIHKELVHQISTRIVEYSKHVKADTIRFEDLRWSKHSSKQDIGYFISTWQTHWFFSKIIHCTSQIARRNGIRTYITDPYKSSKLCSCCGKEGTRYGKIFKCINPVCKIQIDSDLNAARNLGKISRKYYPV